MSLPTGERLGPYEILAPLGAGGMGEVYRARDTRLGREVAIKVLPEEFAKDPERLRRFEGEARSASALSDPHIVTVYDVGEANGVHFFASELVEGSDLRRQMDRGAMPVRKALELAGQIASGLAAAHEKGVVHRDLKPENVLLTKSGNAKIADFGLAKLAESGDGGLSNLPTSDGRQTTAGVVMGTVHYMSPEQARGAPVDFRSDQFAFGTVLYEMLAGRNPFARGSAAQTMAAIIESEAEPLGDLRPEIPESVVWIVDRCLAKRPEERYGSTRDLARDLHQLALRGTDASGRSARVSARGVRAGRTPATRLALGAATVAGALLSGVLVGAAIWRRAPAPPPRIRALTYSGHDLMPASSPDGKTIAFSSDRDGRFRIWIKQLGTGGEAPVTDGIDQNPRFFPDGQSILYSHSENGRHSLYRLALVGGQPRKLIDNADFGDVSPDGREIVFVRSTDEQGRPASAVFAALADGSQTRRIALASAGDMLYLPRFSPDGRTIAISRGGQAGTRGEIRLVSPDGVLRRTVQAPLPNPAVSGVAWSPDGNSLYFNQADSSLGGAVSTEGHLVRYDLKTGRSTLLLWTPATAYTIALAGDRLILDGGLPRENLQTISLGEPGVVREPRWLTRGFTIDRQPAPSADGSRVIFSSSRNGNQDIWSVSLKTGATTSLTDDPADDWDPVLTPDGSHLLWSSNRSGSFEIWIADADGSHPRQVTHDGDAENPTATPDGQWIVYASGVAARAGIWKIRPDGSQPTRLVSGYLLNPEVSPDGVYAAYRVMVAGGSSARVKVLRVADGTILPFEIVAPDSGNGMAGRVRWMRGGRSLAYIAVDESGIQGLFAQDFAASGDTSATRRRLGGFDREAPVESFGITRDDSTLVIAALEPSFNLMTIENVPGLRENRK